MHADTNPYPARGPGRGSAPGSDTGPGRGSAPGPGTGPDPVPPPPPSPGPPPPEPPGEDRHVDGNALAGPLAEVFAVDLTTAVSRCTHCGATGPLACLHVYDRAPGRVARCPHCGAVVLRVVRTPGTLHLDLRGTVALAVPLDDSGE